MDEREVLERLEMVVVGDGTARSRFACVAFCLGVDSLYIGRIGG